MNGISSLLNHKYNEVVLGLMADLSRDFGVEKGQWPHFSYHLSTHYDEVLYEEIRGERLNLSPIVIKTAGLGVFTGPEPVIYISIVRDQQLSTLHQVLWDAGVEHGGYGSPHYEPASWVPHITLTKITGRPFILPEIMRALSGHDFHWQIPIDNVAILSDDEGAVQLKYRWTFEDYG